jgi:hypothetical protein
MLKALFILLSIVGLTATATAHPMPNSVFLLAIKQMGIAAELQLPLGQLGLAMRQDLEAHPETVITQYGAAIKDYVLAHTHIVSTDKAAWTITIQTLTLGKNEQTATGVFNTVTLALWLQPPPAHTPRQCVLHYDGIVEQVVTHKILVAIREDWHNGQVADAPTEVGVIQLDTRSNTVAPLYIHLATGSVWQGFAGMVQLGIQHIAEGTDHLLFLFVLLLPATLLVQDKR